MEIKKNAGVAGKAGIIWKVVTTLIVLLLLIGLVLAARAVVGSVDIFELLKTLHGG